MGQASQGSAQALRLPEFKKHLDNAFRSTVLILKECSVEA